MCSLLRMDENLKCNLLQNEYKVTRKEPTKYHLMTHKDEARANICLDHFSLVTMSMESV